MKENQHHRQKQPFAGEPGNFRWDVLTIGYISRNKFWGESDSQAYRKPRCTSTLIRGGKHAILVDPSCPPEEMIEVLDRRTGLKPEQISMVFLTHFHADHRYGIEAFPQAEWRMGTPEIEACRRSLPVDSPDRKLLDRLQPAEGELMEGIRILDTPGHSSGHVSLLFESEGRQIAAAGDAAMTRDFFFAGDYYFNTVDPKAAVKSIEKLAAAADIVIPGHDNYFLNPRNEGNQ